MREISDAEYRSWSAVYNQAAATINGRGDALDAAAELIEKDMFMLGATAIEDKLQEGVPDAIHTLQMAGIKVPIRSYPSSDEGLRPLMYRLGASRSGFLRVIGRKLRSTSGFRAD